MTNPSSAESDAIRAKIADLRQQMRSYAQQRAEGLIDADLQRELVKDLQSQINDLEAQQAEPSDPATAEAEVVEEIIEADDPVKEDTHEHPDVTVTEPSDEPQHAEAEAVEEIVAGDDTKHAETEMVEEMLEREEQDDPIVEDTNEHPDVTVTDTSDEPQHADKNATIEVIEEESDALHRDDNKAVKLGDFADEVVVSSAITKKDDHNSIHDPNVVDIRDITKTYKMGEFDLQVLKGITMQVRQGEFVSIMGPSGSGKSTLMNILGALDQPTSGEYFLDNLDVSKLDEKQLAEIRNSKIGFVFQSFNLLKRTSAQRQVELPLIYGSHKDRARKAREALEAVGLGQRLDHTPAELSGGQQQRVAIARALVTEPSLILADEPTGNLDSRSGTEVMQLFQTLNRKNNITTIFVTHDPWIARHTDRVIMLRDGKIIADQRVKNPLVAGEAERPSEAEELQAIFESTYYGGDEEEYT